MRKFLIVTLALVFVLGLSELALADNVIDIDQHPSAGQDEEISAIQFGADNGINIRQRVGGNEIFINQIGNRNKIVTGAWADDSDPDNPSIVQAPTSYRAQQDIWSASGFCSVVLDQYGNDNTVGLTQWSGNSAWVSILQEGNNNTALLIQYADYDSGATIGQYGNGNMLKSYQSAVNNNFLTVTQHGGAKAFVFQCGGPSIPTPGDNVVNINQW